MKINSRIIWSIISILLIIPLPMFGQGYGEDPNAIDFCFDPGQSFPNKPSFCQRLSGVKEITLLEPSQNPNGIIIYMAISLITFVVWD